MDEVIKMVADKTGISADQAKSAVETVMGFLKDKEAVTCMSGMTDISILTK